MDLNDYLEQLQDIDEHAAMFRGQIKECSLVEFRVMDLVAECPELCLTDIGIERSVFHQGMGRLAKRLEKRGLAQVVVDERDARMRHLILTEDGEKLLDRCRSVLADIVA